MKELNIESIKSNFPNGLNIEKECLLYDKTTGLPTLQETARMKCLILAICTEGYIQYNIDTEEKHVSKGDLMIINEGQVISNFSKSEDCDAIVLAVSKDFFQEIIAGIKEISKLFLFARLHPVFHINDRLIKEFTNYIQSIKIKILDLDHKFRREVVSCLLKVLIYDMCNVIYYMYNIEESQRTRAEIIFSDFINLVEQNFRKERRVSVYAEKLCITPKYLSETIKQISKRTPSQWIDYYVMLEIRVMLKSTKMSIKQITEKLNFPNQSFLGKYFKEHYGVSPSKYRKK